MNAWAPRDWVALVLAITIFVHFVGFAVVAVLLPNELPNPDRVMAIKEVTLVLLGALSGYLGGRADRPMRETDKSK